MTPESGSHVKLMLRNNVVVEGILENWYGNGVQLKSIDGKRLIMITDPADIMMITVFLEDEDSRPMETPIAPRTELEEKFQEVYDQPSDDPERNKSLAELRILLSEQEKQIIANRLRSHHVGEVKKVEYGFPRFLTKPGAK